MNGEGHSPSWSMVARWVIGIAVPILIAVSGFVAHQILVVIPPIDARQDAALIEMRGQLSAMRDFELSSLRYEMRRLSDSIDKLEDRLRQQEIRNHARD